MYRNRRTIFKAQVYQYWNQPVDYNKNYPPVDNERIYLSTDKLGHRKVILPQQEMESKE